MKLLMCQCRMCKRGRQVTRDEVFIVTFGMACVCVYGYAIGAVWGRIVALIVTLIASALG